VGWLLLGYGGAPDQFWELYGVLFLAVAVGVVVHELGHLLACLAVGAEVKAFRIGGERVAIRFRVRTVQVSLGWPYKGRVEHGGVPSVGRQAVITLAGSLMDLALAGLVLMVSAMAASGQGARPVAVAAALGLGVIGLANLMPFRMRSGRLSDGARLFELRSYVRTAESLAAQKTANRLIRAGRATELLELHAGLDVPAGRMSVAQAANRIVVEFNVVLLAGLPDDAAQLAERRVSMLLRDHDLGPAEPIAYLTLALLWLRRGGPESYAEAERLCERALAAKGVRDPARRMAIAAVIVSRQARGLPYEDVRATAAATLKSANDDPETMAANLKAVLDPEAMLGAFREGDPAARLGVGSIAVMLRRQGQIGELLELHTGFEVPAGRYTREQARSLHVVECNLLLMPGLPPEVIDEAASRVQWIVDNYPFEAKEDPMPRPAVEHTLALARLRQGRFGEVEPLCASGLATDYGPDARATILATIALARRALGQPHADLLAEAVALSPDADLVAEAAGLVPEVHR
jgi:peptidase M50-like protein